MMLTRIARWPSLPPLIFWAISLAVFWVNGGSVVGADHLLPFDSGWYARIVREGYSFDGNYGVQQDIAFFPLSPAFSALLHYVGGIQIDVAELMVSAAMTLASCLLLHRVLLQAFGEPVAKTAIGLWIANPFAIYLFNGYSEAVFLACIAAFFYFLTVQPRLGWAVLAIVGASLARPYGIFLALIFGVYVLWCWRRTGDTKWRNALLIHLPLSLTGYLLWALYCDWRYGDPLVTLHATEAWAGAGMPLTLRGFLSLEGPLEVLRRFATGDTFLDPVALGTLFFFGGLCLFVAWGRRFSPLLTLYGILLPIMVLPNIGQRGGVFNAGRYELPYFMHFAALALLLVTFERRLVRAGDPQAETDTSIPWAFYPIYLAFLSGFMRFTHYFFDGIWVS